MSDKFYYTEDDMRDYNSGEQLGRPGEFPYTRGIHASMYRGKLWTMRQYSGYGDAKETNTRFRYLLDHGQTGLSVAFDLPTQMGLDSDHRLASGEVGRVGVAVNTLEDMDLLFSRIDMDLISTSMTINATACMMLAMYRVLAESRGANGAMLRGTVQNDILKEYLARGCYIFPIKPSLRMTIDLWEYALKKLKRFNVVSVSGYHIREAGATAVEEIGLAFAHGLTYIQTAIDRGIDIDRFAPRISFFFGANNNLLEEVAKFRAARRLWARLIRERFSAKNPKSMMLRFHTQTCGSTLTSQQPENNIIRIALQNLSAVLGGTQSMHTNSYDEALALPSERASKLALRTQQIVAYESGIAELIDPLAGSYWLEKTTDRIESEVVELLNRIDKLGGAIKCLENGTLRSWIDESAYKAHVELETNQRKIVGVNAFADTENETMDLHRVDKHLESRRLKRLTRHRKQRDNSRCSEALDALKMTADSDDNIMDALIEAIKAHATLGEMCGVLHEVFGRADVKL